MIINYTEQDVKNIIETVFGITYDSLEFWDDIQFQRANHDALNSKNTREVTYRLGRTEERYEGVIFLYDSIQGVILKINNDRIHVPAPTMKIAYQHEYRTCTNCFKSVAVSVPLQGYYWLPPQSKPSQTVICYDCHRLERLTNKILLFASLKRIGQKNADEAKQKCINWLASQFGNDINEVQYAFNLINTNMKGC